MYNAFVQVILNNISKSTDQIYTYGVPDALTSSAQEGKRVKVNFGRGKNIIDALIVSVDSTCDYPMEKIKTIIDIIDEKPIVTKEMIKIIFWIRERYICKYSDAMRLMIPSETQSVYEKHVRLKENKEVAEYNINKTPKQLKVIEYLKNHESVSIALLTKKLNISKAVINNLIERDVLEERLILDYSNQAGLQLNKQLCLNEEQKNACETILNSDKKVFLLHGVTGSGKTEVYMNIIEEYLKEGKQSIMLVPEISLTAQTIDRFKKRFGNKIAVFHSKLSKKDRYIQWLRVYNKEADIVIGARSAIFAPIDKLGVIVIDEEHENSYISATSPKYDTMEVAVKMAYMNGGKVILGSATPSLNTYHMVIKGQIELIEMKKRVNDAHMPEMKIINMSAELDKGNNTIISEELYESIRNSLKQNEQVILFLNKRGYSGFVSCRKCGYVVRCQRCDVSMTYHIKGNVMKCHYCGRTRKMIYECPKCSSDKIEQFSAGTQHVEKLVNQLFPHASIERMDLDSMTDTDCYENIYNDFKSKKIDILIGTQMLAKGFDFPNVTTVGVLSADAILNLPFYNASEKTFQLITQVSGRAGRGNKKGRVYIQTYEPENHIINAAKNNDYEFFLHQELKLRKEFAFPPFINIINICLISRNEELVVKTANEKYLEVKEAVKVMVKERSLLLYRPVPHNIYKVNDEYRINLFIKASNHSLSQLRKILRTVYMEKDIENIKVSININTDTI
ncbi:MAG: primosomal protein N' [Tissierellia bacterium]|nr:primosomal protein N' [Tissierellia bacterium]MDD3227032.1 primosomal protein N' [Tissierellia bacterium]MDD4045942.1 primosomal protein N' [Tissierellia bacterium]MDD4678043.1 primosomal protein N' [Tissierellia bacterium]